MKKIQPLGPFRRVVQSRLIEGLRKGEKMQVSSKANTSCYPPYLRKHKGENRGGFSQTFESDGTTNETTEKVVGVQGTDLQEVHRARMSGKTLRLFEGTECGENVGAVGLADSEDGEEFLGLTMVPEEGQKVTYGMRAMLSSKSTPDNPIVQVVSNLGGKKQIYNVQINKVNPENATQLEMFALLSYSDKMGLTEGGSFGSHQQLETYAKNAELHGYCNSLAGEEVYLNQTFDWTDIVAKMMNDYQGAELDKEYEECKKLYEYFLTFNEGEDYQKILRKKMEEILKKIQSGDTEPTYRIGAQTFTEKEWDEFLERFDSLEDAIRELMRERFEKEEEEREEKKTIADEMAQQEIINKYGDIFGDEKVTKVIEMEVVSFSSGLSLHFNSDTNEVSCTDDRPGRNYLWTLPISKEDRERSRELFVRTPKDGHWEYEYAEYLKQKSFWEAYLSGTINLTTIMQMKAAGIEKYVDEGVATENYRIVSHNDEGYLNN